MTEPRRILVKIGDEAPNRLDKALARELPADLGLSRTRITRLIREGHVTRQGIAVVEPDASVRPGEEWWIAFNSQINPSLVGENIPLNVVYEDADMIVVDKSAGMVVHPAKNHRQGTLVHALIHRFGNQFAGIADNQRPGIVHRLDKDTSGLLVAAKSQLAMVRLAEQFQDRSASRRYLAVIRGTPAPGAGFGHRIQVSFEADGWIRIEGDIGRHRKHRDRMDVVPRTGRHAVTRIRVVSCHHSRLVSLIECRLETGRTHQIRVHLQRAGYPVIGDPVYSMNTKILPQKIDEKARSKAAEFPRQALHAANLVLHHPRTGAIVRFNSPLPEDMRTLVDALKLRLNDA